MEHHEPTDCKTSAQADRSPENGTTGGVPVKRSNSSILRAKKKYAVRNSLLANIFFPHEYSHRVATVDEAKESRKSKRGGAMGEPSTTDVAVAEVAAADRHDNYLEKAARVIQSKQAQWAFTALLVIDVLLIIAELVIESNKNCVLEPLHDVHHVSPTYHTSNHLCNTTEITFLGQSPDSHNIRFFEVSQADCPFEAIPELSHGLHLAETILSWIGKGIIFIFAAELLVLIAALRMHFFRNRMYLIDLVIVSVSVVVDWTVSKDQPSAHLVILIRCWRFARILHGVGISVHEMEEIEVEHVVDDDGNIVQDGDMDRVVPSRKVDGSTLPSPREGVMPPEAPSGGGDVQVEDPVRRPSYRTQRVKYHVIRTSAPRFTSDES